MKKLLTLIALSSLFLLTCKKNDLTPDGKPQSDAANNTIRVDTKAGASYTLLVAETDPNNVDHPRVYYTNNNLNTASEYTFTGVNGDNMLVEVWSQNGTSATADIYYKGSKVSHAIMGVDSLDGVMPSHINLTYTIGATTR